MTVKFFEKPIKRKLIFSRYVKKTQLKHEYSKKTNKTTGIIRFYSLYREMSHIGPFSRTTLYVFFFPHRGKEQKKKKKLYLFIQIRPLETEAAFFVYTSLCRGDFYMRTVNNTKKRERGKKNK